MSEALPFWFSVRGPDVIVSRTGVALNSEQADTMLRAYDTALGDAEGRPPHPPSAPPFLDVEGVRQRRADLITAIQLQGWATLPAPKADVSGGEV